LPQNTNTKDLKNFMILMLAGGSKNFAVEHTISKNTGRRILIFAPIRSIQKSMFPICP